MLLTGLRSVIKSSPRQIYLVLESQAIVAARPNRAPYRGHGRDDASQKAGVKLFGQNLLLGKFGDFVHERPNFVLGLLHEQRIRAGRFAWSRCSRRWRSRQWHLGE